MVSSLCGEIFFCICVMDFVIETRDNFYSAIYFPCVLELKEIDWTHTKKRYDVEPTKESGPVVERYKCKSQGCGIGEIYRGRYARVHTKRFLLPCK
jgi:hypothetical protein